MASKQASNPNNQDTVLGNVDDELHRLSLANGQIFDSSATEKKDMAVQTENTSITDTGKLEEIFDTVMPYFDGNPRFLAFFLDKCDYTYNLLMALSGKHYYIMLLISKRLTGKAVLFKSNVIATKNFDMFKIIMTKRFGIKKTEQILAMEMESLSLKQGESYTDFCERIQFARSNLIAKVSLDTPDPVLKASKIAIHNKSALNIFLTYLPPDLHKLIRFRKPMETLEEALRLVEELESVLYRRKMWRLQRGLSD